MKLFDLRLGHRFLAYRCEQAELLAKGLPPQPKQPIPWFAASPYRVSWSSLASRAVAAPWRREHLNRIFSLRPSKAGSMQN